MMASDQAMNIKVSAVCSAPGAAGHAASTTADRPSNLVETWQTDGHFVPRLAYGNKGEGQQMPVKTVDGSLISLLSRRWLGFA